MQIDETVHGCPVGRRCGSPDRQVGDPGSPSQIRTTSGPPPLVAATGRTMERTLLGSVVIFDVPPPSRLDAYVHKPDGIFNQPAHLRFNNSRLFARARAAPAPWGGACRWRL